MLGSAGHKWKVGVPTGLSPHRLNGPQGDLQADAYEAWPHAHADALRLLAQLDVAQQRAVPVNLNQARELHQRGQIAEAEKAYRAILRTDPKHVDAVYLLGIAFLQQKKFEAAEQQIGMATSPSPSEKIS